MTRYDPDKEDKTVYKVVVNCEEQYSIWPADRVNPPGWREVGKSGPNAECLAYIKEVWTDMRPLSLRKKMGEASQNRGDSPAGKSPAGEPPTKSIDSITRDDLVRYLSEGDHPVEISLGTETNAQALKECIDRGYVHIRFSNTKGGAELGVRLDRDASNLSQADFYNQTGNVRLEGGLMLNRVKVRCIADIDLKTLNGKGHLGHVDE